MPAERAQYELARPIFHYLGEMEGPAEPRREDVRMRVRSRLGAELAQQLFDDPAAMQARSSTCSPSYWAESFAEEWERLEPILAEEVDRAGGRDPIELWARSPRS